MVRAPKRLSRRAILRAGAGAAVLGLGVPRLAAWAATAPPTAPGVPAAPASAPTRIAAPAQTGKQVTLNYWSFTMDSPYIQSLYTDAFAKFEKKYPNIKVSPDFQPTTADMRKKLVATFAAGSGLPDCSHFQTLWLAEFIDAGMLEPLDDRIKAWQRVGDFLPIALQISKQRTSDPTCIMLHDMHINYLYYRADWLKEAGLKPPDTLDDMLEVAKAFTKPPNRYGYGFRGGDGWGFNLQLLHYLKANGVDVVKEDGSTDIDSPPAVETVDWYASLATKHKVVQPSAATDKYPQLYAALQGGKIGLFQHGLWSWKIQNDVLGEKISAVQVPKGKARRWISVYGEGTVVYRTSKLKDEAWLLASFLAEPEQQAIFGKERGGPPLFKSTQDDRFYKESRFFQAAMMSKESWGQQPSWHRRWPEMEDRFAPEMQRILSGESKSAEFCRIMAEIFRKK